jgi:hypothetical protein
MGGGAGQCIGSNESFFKINNIYFLTQRKKNSLVKNNILIQE